MEEMPYNSYGNSPSNRYYYYYFMRLLLYGFALQHDLYVLIWPNWMIIRKKYYTHTFVKPPPGRSPAKKFESI